MRTALVTATTITAIIGITVAANAAAASIKGRWTTKEKDSVIEVASCGTAMCGRVSKFLRTPPGGVDQKDIKNADKNLRSRKIMGMAVLHSLKADGEVWRGTIYDPRNGKSYRSVVYLQKNGNLNVKGCLGPICQSQVWTPAG